jgi:cysteine desulfurase
MNPIYLDYNATTPIDKEVAEAMKPFLYELFGNPSSSHEFGVRTKRAVITARHQVADLIGCSTEEIIFTSGGTESNNFAIKGVAFANKHKGNHIITSAIEHPAVIEVCKYLASKDFRITYLPVDEFGWIDPDNVKKAITSKTILISIMHANNEVGTIQPIEEIGEIAQKYKVFFHTDAAQSAGKIEVDVSRIKVDLLSIAGHKLYAPKGIGALYIRKGVTLEKLIHGADHEMNQRAGTENILGISGLGKACEIAKHNLEKNRIHVLSMRNLLYTGISEIFPGVKLNGHPKKRLPNTLSVSFEGVEAKTLLSELPGIAASSGAACHTDRMDISSVLRAMKVEEGYAKGTIRFSTGKYTTFLEIQQAVNEIKAAVKRLKGTEKPSVP